VWICERVYLFVRVNNFGFRAVGIDTLSLRPSTCTSEILNEGG